MVFIKNTLIIFIVSIFALLGIGANGQKAITQQQQQANTPPKPKASALLPDVTVASPHISLESTELGKPGVEFPNDKVRFTAILKNSGLGPCPAGGSYSITLLRNGQFLTSSTATELLGAAGSTYNYSYSDSFLHEQWPQVSYKITVAPNFKEADSNNNSAETMAGEEILHGSGFPDFGVTDFTSSFVDGSAGRTYYFTVTVENASLIYMTVGTSGYIYVEKMSGANIAMLYLGDRKWPGPKARARFTLNAKASDMPSGIYTLQARVETQYDPNRNNNVSVQHPQIKNAP
jgi:hypothetical protein